MSYANKGKEGYIPGINITFTPSKKADWTEEFNQLLEKSDLSRNKLTSDLISDGLKYRKLKEHDKDYVFIPNESFSKEQKAILNSKEGQFIIRNLIQAALFGNAQLNFNQPVQNGHGADHELIDEKQDSSLVAAEVETEQPKKMSVKDRLLERTKKISMPNE